MKILKEKYPMGSFKGQKSDGRYIDETLYSNIKILAEKAKDDMTFLIFFFSSTLEVGTGKSVFASQVADAWTYAVNEHLGTNIPFDINNCVFKPKDLIDRAFKVPKYSAIVLDEWEDSHYWSELGITLRQFFRKCRQLNLLIICIIPNFFQLPLGYAISRSVAAIDVKFGNGFERGYFDFYNFNQKKELYIKGKKFHNYSAASPSFQGVFANGYAYDEVEYRKAKYKDMVESDEEDKRPTEKQIRAKLFKQLYQNLEGITVKKLSEAFGVSDRTGSRYLSSEKDEDEGTAQPTEDSGVTI